MKKTVLNIEIKINLLENLNNIMINSKSKIYDLNNFDKEFVKYEESNFHEHVILYKIWKEEKNLLANCVELDARIINILKEINEKLEIFKFEYYLKNNNKKGVKKMKNENIMLKEIKDVFNGGMYYLTNKESRKLISSDGKATGYLNCIEKINILNAIITTILNNSFNEEKKDCYDKLFNNIFDLENASLEQDINNLYHRVMYLYYKPQKDIKTIKTIRDYINKCLFVENNTDFKVKNLINERVCYM